MKKFISSSPMLLIFLLALLVAKCGARSEKKPELSQESIAVKLADIKFTDYAPKMIYSGVIASKTEGRPSFKISGIISKIYVKEGDKVSRGQLLASLDLTEINAQVQQSQQQLDKNNRDLNRIKNLYEDTVATLEQLQNSGTQVSVANESLRIAKFNQQYAQIRASENGTVLKKILNEGDFASAGTPVLQIIGTTSKDWVVRFGVSDKDWANIKQGDKAEILIDAYPENPFTGTVSEIADAADPLNGTYEIEVKVLPGSYRFAPGLFSTIQLKSTVKRQLMMVPIEALTEADGTTGYVYTLNDDGKTVVRRQVKIVFIEKDFVAVASGLDGVSRVITDGAGYLTQNSIVNVSKN
ncbi:MAG: efflux RND transporter periplasmic adaptor subunit [Gemmatimonadaceae bacterium]|nr:efflux RND transporter periplasmic adaptor subunit [Chitinophagaceae bacterium]